MHVDTMQMDPRIATIYYRDYRHKVRANRQERRKQLEAQAKAAGKELGRIRIEKTRMEREDEELMQAYRALAKGQRIINAHTVIQKAGVNAKFEPILAMARADWATCYFHAANKGQAVFSSESYLSSWGRRPASKIVPFPASIFPTQTQNALRALKALVPAIPAHLRPAGDLSDYFILWEAKWEPHAPVDPLLLRHVGGNIYAILAQWDLTPIEQSILEGRLR